MAYNTALKMAILEGGITQLVVAQEAGIHESKMSRFIRGHQQPTQAEKRAIARAVRRPVDEVFPEKDGVPA